MGPLRYRRTVIPREGYSTERGRRETREGSGFAEINPRTPNPEPLQALLDHLDTVRHPVEVFLGVIETGGEAQGVRVVDVLVHVADGDVGLREQAVLQVRRPDAVHREGDEARQVLLRRDDRDPLHAGEEFMRVLAEPLDARVRPLQPHFVADPLGGDLLPNEQREVVTADIEAARARRRGEGRAVVIERAALHAAAEGLLDLADAAGADVERARPLRPADP